MNDAQTSGPEATRSRLRTLVATLDQSLAALLKQGTDDDARRHAETLRTAFAELVTALDLGPEPELRSCPNCQRTGLRAAKLCGFCWVALTPA